MSLGQVTGRAQVVTPTCSRAKPIAFGAALKNQVVAVCCPARALVAAKAKATGSARDAKPKYLPPRRRATTAICQGVGGRFSVGPCTTQTVGFVAAAAGPAVGMMMVTTLETLASCATTAAALPTVEMTVVATAMATATATATATVVASARVATTAAPTVALTAMATDMATATATAVASAKVATTAAPTVVLTAMATVEATVEATVVAGGAMRVVALALDQKTEGD